jgi:hypothetical protein
MAADQLRIHNPKQNLKDASKSMKVQLLNDNQILIFGVATGSGFDAAQATANPVVITVAYTDHTPIPKPIAYQSALYNHPDSTRKWQYRWLAVVGSADTPMKVGQYDLSAYLVSNQNGTQKYEKGIHVVKKGGSPTKEEESKEPKEPKKSCKVTRSTISGTTGSNPPTFYYPYPCQDVAPDIKNGYFYPCGTSPAGMLIQGVTLVGPNGSPQYKGVPYNYLGEPNIWCVAEWTTPVNDDMMAETLTATDADDSTAFMTVDEKE